VKRTGPFVSFDVKRDLWVFKVLKKIHYLALLPWNPVGIENGFEWVFFDIHQNQTQLSKV